MWLHTKPQNEGKPGAQADVVCTGTSSLNNMNCDTYSRVKFEMESSTKVSFKAKQIVSFNKDAKFSSTILTLLSRL